MPKSKRSKIVSLTRTEKKTRSSKTSIVDEVHKCLDEFGALYVISFENMRNVKLKDVRTAWSHSRFFLGKNKVMQVALGKGPEDEYKPNLHQISQLLVGNVGLLFTNQSQEEVVEFFGKLHEADFARSGFKATKTVVLSEGPLPDFPHSMEPQLRKLGLPTSLQRGVVTLMGEYTVCTEGEPLTPEQARILQKLAGLPMADFHIKLLAVWTLGNMTLLEAPTPLEGQAAAAMEDGEEAGDGEGEGDE